MMTHGKQTFVFANPKGFPKEARQQIEEMVLDKLFYLDETGTIDMSDVGVQFERFMKLAGPYWMSCVTKNDDVPILDPDHYRSYLDQSR